MQAETLIATDGCYVGIYDSGSPANSLGFMTTALRAAMLEAVQSKEEAFYGLFLFNEKLLSLSEQGHLLSWTLLLDGVFRAVVQDGGQRKLSAVPSRNLGSSIMEARLACPTGKIMISCLSKLGEAHGPLLTVEPGAYHVTLERNEAEEFAHACLESPEEYPSDEGPDWLIHVHRIDF